MPQLMRRLSFLITSSGLVLFGACGGAAEIADQAVSSATPAPTATLSESDRLLGSCVAKDIEVEKSTPPTGAKPASAFEGEDPSKRPSKVLHANVTIGKSLGRRPRSDDLSKDSAAKAISRRPAWVHIYEDAKFPLLGGPAPISEEDARLAPRLYASGFAEIHDSKTGELLEGWNCGSERVYPDGRVERFFADGRKLEIFPDGRKIESRQGE